MYDIGKRNDCAPAVPSNCSNQVLNFTADFVRFISISQKALRKCKEKLNTLFARTTRGIYSDRFRELAASFKTNNNE